MKAILLLAAITAAGLLVSAAPVLAHHSFSAEFDAKQPVKLTGTVTRLDWANPHAWLYIDVKDETGKVTNWGLELGGPNALMRLGWSRNSLKPGDTITAEGTRAKDGSSVVNARSITLNGKRMFAGSSQGVTP